MAKPRRADVIVLLNRLGNSDDADVLLAARALHNSVTDAGLTWDDLLIPESPAQPGELRDTASAPAGSADDETESIPGSEPTDAEIHQQDAGRTEAEEIERLVTNADKDLEIVERLLAQEELSEETRRDLLDFSRDIAEKKLTVADSSYIRALAKRLGL